MSEESAMQDVQPTEEIAQVPSSPIEPVDGAEVWDDELPGRPIRKRLGPPTLIMLALVIAGGAFYAGVRVEKSKVGSSSSSGSSLASLIQRFASARGATGATGGATSGGGGGGLGGAARGTITLIDGSNVYITESDGTIVKVATNPSTTFQVASTGSITNLHPGDTVIVAGPTGSDGTITARSVSDAGASGTSPIRAGSGTGTGTGGGRGGGGRGQVGG
jgi:hypothetical protein